MIDRRMRGTSKDVHLGKLFSHRLTLALCFGPVLGGLGCAQPSGQQPGKQESQGKLEKPDPEANKPGSPDPKENKPGGSNPDANKDPSSPVFEKRASQRGRIMEPELGEGLRESFAKGNLELSLEMLRGLDPEAGSNKAVSALSLRCAFGMVHGMAKGETQDEIAKALHLPEDPQQTQSAINATDLWLLANNLPKSTHEDAVIFSTANRVFVSKSLQPGKAYLDLLAENYGTGVMAADFENDSPEILKEINRWVSEQTHERIPKILGPEDINARTTWALVNALYFKAPWAFDSSQPSPGKFTLKDGSESEAQYVKASQMSSRYGKADGVTWVHLPLRGNELALTLIVPDEGKFDELRGELSAEMLQGWFDQEKEGIVSLRFPKFKVESKKMNLVPMLKRQGMKLAFENPDFSGFGQEGGGLDEITFVYQSVSVAADENGLEAAAATSAGSSKSAAEIDFEFSVDRPFLFLVQDRSLGVALFAGQILDPSR